MNFNKTNVILLVIIVLVVAVIAFLMFKNNNNTNSNSQIPSPSQPVTSQSGLQIQDEIMGTGTIAVAGKMVTLNYVGTFTDGKKFDSSYDRGEPLPPFVLGAGNVIQGWDEGVAGMRVGGKRKLTIPPELGYGNRDYGPIPANSTLIFEVELLDVKSVN